MNTRTNPFNDIGRIIGRYTVLNVFREENRTYYSVKCDAGHIRDKVRADALKRDADKCFDCDRRNVDYKSDTYNSWNAMVQRCTNPNNTAYHKYGAVGITVHSAWCEPDGEGFKNFVADVGYCPDGLTLDRWPNKFGNYEPNNVRWASNSQQGYNQKKRSTNTSGRTGVSWDSSRGRWSAQITYENTNLHLGRYDSFEEAVRAREEAELKYFGENKE